MSLTLYTFAPNIDPQMKIARYKRTKADNELLGLSQVYHCCIRMLWIWPFLAHLTQRVKWAIVTTERPSVRPSVNFSHFNQLLWSHWANLNQTLVEWSLDGPFPKLCPVIPTSNQDGGQAKNRKKGGWNFNCSLLL